MKFELEPYQRDVTKEQIREDIRRVASEIGKTAITQADYSHHGGQYSSHLARRHFGSWFAALAEAGLDKTRNLNLSDDELIGDLQKVAERLHKIAVTQAEYSEHGKYSPGSFVRRFGSWFKALETAGLKHTRIWGVKNEQYFENLEEMWLKLGRQPHYRDVQKPFSKYSTGAYERRFGSWRKALEAFVNSANEETSGVPSGVKPVAESSSAPSPNCSEAASKLHQTPRTANWRQRAQVLLRDGATCRMCGTRPEHGARLHVDHIIPWAKGGETVLENLQILCERCNIGKSDLSMPQADES